jgi:hypothetical protein
MKRFFGFALMLALISAPAFAGNNKSQNLTIPEAVQVGSTQVPAGDYKLTWTGEGSGVQVTLAQRNKTVVTFSAKAVAGNNSPGINTETKSGVNQLQSIQLSKLSLVLESATSSGQ